MQPTPNPTPVPTVSPTNPTPVPTVSPTTASPTQPLDSAIYTIAASQHIVNITLESWSIDKSGCEKVFVATVTDLLNSFENNIKSVNITSATNPARRKLAASDSPYIIVLYDILFWSTSQNQANSLANSIEISLETSVTNGSFTQKMQFFASVNNVNQLEHSSSDQVTMTLEDSGAADDDDDDDDSTNKNRVEFKLGELIGIILACIVACIIIYCVCKNFKNCGGGSSGNPMKKAPLASKRPYNELEEDDDVL